jgi:hypothetical protein
MVVLATIGEKAFVPSLLEAPGVVATAPAAKGKPQGKKSCRGELQHRHGEAPERVPEEN